MLVLLSVAFSTGWVAFSFATAPSRWSLVLHATAGIAIVVVLPWKSIIARRGMQRPRPRRWMSIVLTVLVLMSLAAGLAHSTGVAISFGPLTAMEVHVGAAIAAVPFAAWHVMARRIRLPATDVSRRDFLKTGLALVVASTAYAGSELVVHAANLPGASRRFTGSYEAGSFEPELMPVSSWMFDSIPPISQAQWRLRVADREMSYSDLAEFTDEITATLDCTGGFFSTQHWSGARLDRLIGRTPGSSIRVISHTGYDRRFPRDEANRLWLAIRFGDQPLDEGHGFPARIVAPGRRGFWWVKWVASIEVDDLPYWWQSPFPTQ